MGIEETKHDLLLKRIQITIGILSGIVALSVGLYNVKKSFFSENGPGEIVVQVKAATGQALPKARVELYNSQNTMISASETNSQGRYVKKIDAGSYSVKVSLPGFQMELMSTQVSPGKTTDLNVVLKLQAGSKIFSALEETGASWIKKKFSGDKSG